MLQSLLQHPVSGVSRYLVPDLPSADELLPHLRRIDAARWYSNFGPLVCEFEERLRSLLAGDDTYAEAGKIHLTTLVSGYQALEIALRVAGIGEGKKVLVPAITFSACPLAVLHAGAEVILTEVDPNNWSLTPGIARAAAEHTRVDAVMPVAVYGVPLPESKWDEFSGDTGIPVIIDAAAAIHVQRLPRLGLVAHSLHATKPLGVGVGGFLASRDPDAIARARTYSNFGMSHRICQADGTNAKMSEYHAAVGLAQIIRWSVVRNKRKQLLQRYQDPLKPLSACISLHPGVGLSVVSCLMLLLNAPPERVASLLTDSPNVGFHRTYLPPLYRHPYFSNLPVVDAAGVLLDGYADCARKAAHLLTCECLARTLVGVPFHPFMEEADVTDVVDTLTKALRL